MRITSSVARAMVRAFVRGSRVFSASEKIDMDGKIALQLKSGEYDVTVNNDQLNWSPPHQ